jgi:DnaJ-class molecular chaperone
MTPQAAKPDEDRSVCTPCRGTGTVVSNLGGQAHEVKCPWCDGTGKYAPGRDAQQSPAEAGAEPPAASEN